jgi:hypothetical protein
MRRETRDGDGLTGRASAVDRTDAGPGQGGHIQESALRKTQFGGKPMGESHPSLATAPDCRPLTEQPGKDLQPMPSRDFWPLTLRPCSGALPGRSAKPARSSISWGGLWDVTMARGSFRRRGHAHELGSDLVEEPLTGWARRRAGLRGHLCCRVYRRSWAPANRTIAVHAV